MRRLVVSLAAAALILPASLEADTVIRPRQSPDVSRPSDVSTPSAVRVLTSPLDVPATRLIVPFFEVDTTDPSGLTTLYAVRNQANAPNNLQISYLASDGTESREDLVVLDPRETLTINLRGVAGLPVDPDGFARGLVIVQAASPVTGDFFQVDVGNDFATGERMIQNDDACSGHEVRFLDFGSGSELTVIVDAPLGSDPDLDPPTFTVFPVLEDGGALAGIEVFTDQVLLFLRESDFTSEQFGTLVFQFANSGWVYAEYSAEGRFSVGLNSSCTVP